MLGPGLQLRFSCLLDYRIILLFYLPYLNMKGHEQSPTLKSSLAKLELNERLPSLKSLIEEYEQEDNRKQDTINTIKNISSRSSKLCSSEAEMVSKNRKITVSYDKKKDMIVTEIVVSEQTVKYISDEDLGLDDGKFYNHPYLDEEVNEKGITRKIEDVAKMLLDYCKYKDFTLPKQITMEAMNLHFRIYSCMLYAISSQFRLFPIYSCSLDELDHLIAEDTPKTALGDLIRTPFKQLLRQTIRESEILSELFKLLRSPDFPVSKFTTKKKITFLLMLAEALSPKKKKSNKKKNKKKNTETVDKAKQQPEEVESPQPELHQQIYEKIQSLDNENHRYEVALSANFIKNLTIEIRKIKP